MDEIRLICHCGWSGLLSELRTIQLLENTVEGCPVCGREVTQQPEPAAEVALEVSGDRARVLVVRGAPHVELTLVATAQPQGIREMMAKWQPVTINGVEYYITGMDVSSNDVELRSDPRGGGGMLFPDLMEYEGDDDGWEDDDDGD